MTAFKSVAATRLDDFVCREVVIRVTWSDATLRGAQLDVVPIGKNYFLRLLVDGQPRMINANAVLELAIAEAV